MTIEWSKRAKAIREQLCERAAPGYFDREARAIWLLKSKLPESVRKRVIVR